jgi:glycosyltransferase involved in cell wall biosynthesis
MTEPATIECPATAFEPQSKLALSVLVPVYNERHVVEASLRRVLAVKSPLLRSLEVIVVDDRSSDGTWEILDRVAQTDPRITLLRHERNSGKGAALRTALAHATGDVTIVHDADLEYNPHDIPALLVPFVEEGADAVFGSRYISAPYRRALMHRHTVINKTLTTISNWLTDLSLTDIETCYKAVKTELLKSIPIRSNDFRFEVEITFKLAKRRARVFEVPIRYLPRTMEEGKKIRAWDGVLALLAMLRFWIIDDIYKKDEYGSHILVELERARRFNLWLGHTIRPYVGDRVLEIGAGIGTLTNQFIPRETYLASDINPNYLHYLHSYSHGKPYLRIQKIDAENPADFAGLEGRFDTAILINVLEHLAGRGTALKNLYNSLEPGGRAIVLVPQHPEIYGTLDEVLEHKLRYDPQSFAADVRAAGFEIERLFDFNRFAVPGWWLNGRLLRRKSFSRTQLKTVDLLMPLFRRIDRLFPWSGLSLIAVAVKPRTDAAQLPAAGGVA